VPWLRLFGPLADVAGTRRDEVSGATVDEVLASARARYGPAFAEMLQVCKVWVNGVPTAPGLVLDDDDEVALLPPVSGG